MPRRAFIPEAPGELEGRVVPSVAAIAHGSAALSGLRYNTAINLIRGDFELYGSSGDFSRLRAMLARDTKGLPFYKADQVGQTVNGLLGEMLNNQRAGIPHAVKNGLRSVVEAIHADLQARIEDGTIRVVP